MNVHKNARLTVPGRLLPIERVRVAGWRVVDAAAAAGVSERTAYTWLARYRAGGARALHDRSSAPARSPRHLTTQPYRPRTPGKAERFIQTALRAGLSAKPYASSAARAHDRAAWLHWDHHHRPHAAINAATPAARLNNLLGNNT